MTKLEFDSALRAIGSPHELWMSLMPEHYVELSDEAKMDHVSLIPDLVYFSIVIRNSNLKLAGAKQIEQRHWELAIMTFVLLRLSQWYRRIFELHMCRAYADAETAIRYALLTAAPLSSTTDLTAGLRRYQLEFSGDLLNHYMSQPKARQLADNLNVFKQYE